MIKLQQKQAELAAKQKDLAQMFKDHPDLDFSEEQVHDIQTKNAEIEAVGKEVQALLQTKEALEAAAKGWSDYNTVTNNYGHSEGSGDGERKDDDKTLGELFVESRTYQAYRGGSIALKNLAVDLPTFDPQSLQVKTLSEGTPTYAPKNVRSDTVVGYPLQRPMVIDFIPSYTTQNQITKWMAEGAPTDNSGVTAEGAAPSESVLVWSEQTATIEKVASFITVTQEQVDDVPNLRQLIDTRLMDLHRSREEYVVITNNGSNYKGFYNFANIQSQAKGTDPTPDAIYKAITLVRTSSTSLGSEPDHIIMHPNDWQDIQLLRTPDGLYIWGSPAQPVTTPYIWGLPVVVTTFATQNTGLLGDFMHYSRLARRQGIEMAMSDSHSDNFTKNILTIKTTSRLALENYRGAAFCKVPGI